MDEKMLYAWCIAAVHPLMSLSLRVFAALWLLLLACAAGASPIIDIGSSDTHYVGEENVEVLLDPTHELSLQDIMRLAPESFSDQKSLQLGFTSSTVWLRLHVYRHLHAPPTWWLVFDQPLLDLIRIYVPASDGTHQERRGGIYMPFGAREIISRRPAFSIDLPANETQTIYVRLNSQNTLSTGIQLMEPAAFSALSTLEALGFGAFFGFYLLTLLCYLLFWYWTREVVSGLYLLYLTFGAAVAALSTGYLQRQLLPDLPLSDVVVIIPFAGALITGMLFGIQILGVRKTAPRSAVVLMAAAGLITGAALVAVAVDMTTIALVILEIGLLFTMTVLTAVAIVRALHRNPSAWLYLAAFSVLHIGMALRFLRDLGLTPINALSENGIYFGITLHILMMSIAIFWRYDQLRRDKDQAQAAPASQRACIIDQGEGIPPDELPRLFQRFFHVQPSAIPARAWGFICASASFGSTAAKSKSSANWAKARNSGSGCRSARWPDRHSGRLAENGLHIAVVRHVQRRRRELLHQQHGHAFAASAAR
jgi:hypothetical protein